MSTRWICGLSLAGGIVFSAMAGYATEAEDAITYRQAVFTIMEWHWTPLAEMVKGRQPFNAEQFVYHVEIIDMMNKLPLEAFIPGTDRGEKTKARPEIWENWGDFKNKMATMQQETSRLLTAAKSGNIDSVRTSFVATAQACKACHDEYRNK
jgi:cytochrome c556